MEEEGIDFKPRKKPSKRDLPTQKKEDKDMFDDLPKPPVVLPITEDTPREVKSLIKLWGEDVARGILQPEPEEKSALQNSMRFSDNRNDPEKLREHIEAARNRRLCEKERKTRMGRQLSYHDREARRAKRKKDEKWKRERKEEAKRHRKAL